MKARYDIGLYETMATPMMNRVDRITQILKKPRLKFICSPRA
jgi:hypothetical protein